MNNTFKMYINLSYLIIIQYYLYKKNLYNITYINNNKNIK